MPQRKRAVKRNAAFDDILCDTAEFLKENPTETVIVSIKMDFGVNVKDFYKSFRSRYIDSQKDLWHTENKIPKLGAVRGKIVLMRRCMLGTNDLSSVDNGLDFSYWEDQKGTGQSPAAAVLVRKRKKRKGNNTGPIRP